MTGQFGDVVQALRDAGVQAHIAIGGHFPSFDYETVMAEIPGADSVIRFEGEATLTDLLDTLSTGTEWQGVVLVWQKFGRFSDWQSYHAAMLGSRLSFAV